MSQQAKTTGGHLTSHALLHAPKGADPVPRPGPGTYQVLNKYLFNQIVEWTQLLGY